jgi:hypothetical protein
MQSASATISIFSTTLERQKRRHTDESKESILYKKIRPARLVRPSPIFWEEYPDELERVGVLSPLLAQWEECLPIYEPPGVSSTMIYWQ